MARTDSACLLALRRGVLAPVRPTTNVELEWGNRPLARPRRFTGHACQGTERWASLDRHDGDGPWRACAGREGAGRELLCEARRLRPRPPPTRTSPGSRSKAIGSRPAEGHRSGRSPWTQRLFSRDCCGPTCDQKHRDDGETDHPGARATSRGRIASDPQCAGRVPATNIGRRPAQSALSRLALWPPRSLSGSVG